MGSERGEEARRLVERIEKPVVELLPVAWPVLAALGLIIVGFGVLPDQLRAGPGQWFSIVMGGLTLALAVMVGLDHYLWRGHLWLRTAKRYLSLVVTGMLTAGIAFGAAFLVEELPERAIEPLDLLFNGALIWAMNVLVFTVWYWEIDAGGPYARLERGYSTVDFVFPQFSADNPKLGESWMPGFVDYLFLAFTTNTAFSPTDTMVLSRRAKLLMMVQSTIALVVFAVLLARAVGTV